MKRLILISTILIIILLGYNEVIRLGARNNQRHQLLSRLAAMQDDTDCIFLGNSLVEAGCNPSVFQAAWPYARSAPHAFNLALGATSPVEHYLLLNRAMQKGERIRYVIYGFFDDQLVAPVAGAFSDLVGNRALSLDFPREAARFYSQKAWVKQCQLSLLRDIPMVAERYSLWAKVERLRRTLEGIGMPKRRTTRYGRADDFAALEPRDQAAFDQRCRKALAEKAGFSPAISAILSLVNSHGAKVVFVEMPMPSRHRRIFYSSKAWLELRNYLQTLAARERAVYLPASDWVTNDDNFEDATHLSERGAEFFSARLADSLAHLNVPANVIASKSPQSR
jgi:hypothetical protein